MGREEVEPQPSRCTNTGSWHKSCDKSLLKGEKEKAILAFFLWVWGGFFKVGFVVFLLFFVGLFFNFGDFPRKIFPIELLIIIRLGSQHGFIFAARKPSPALG